jgi:hypothetical protein
MSQRRSTTTVTSLPLIKSARRHLSDLIAWAASELLLEEALLDLVRRPLGERQLQRIGIFGADRHVDDAEDLPITRVHHGRAGARQAGEKVGVVLTALDDERPTVRESRPDPARTTSTSS